MEIVTVMLDDGNTLGITAVKKICSERCGHCSTKMCKILKISYCFNPKKALFVRHARNDKNGRKYSYGEYYCARILVDSTKDVSFATSEINWMKKRL